MRRELLGALLESDLLLRDCMELIEVTVDTNKHGVKPKVRFTKKKNNIRGVDSTLHEPSAPKKSALGNISDAAGELASEIGGHIRGSNILSHGASALSGALIGGHLAKKHIHGQLLKYGVPAALAVGAGGYLLGKAGNNR